MITIKKLTEYWDGYERLRERAVKFLLKDQDFESLCIDDKYIYIRYNEYRRGENLHRYQVVPLIYFCQDGDSSVKEFFDNEQSEEEEKRRTAKEAQLVREEKAEKESLEALM